MGMAGKIKANDQRQINIFKKLLLLLTQQQLFIPASLVVYSLSANLLTTDTWNNYSPDPN